MVKLLPRTAALRSRLTIPLVVLMGAGLVVLWADRQQMQHEIDALRGAGVPSSRDTSEPSRGDGATIVGDAPPSKPQVTESPSLIVGAWSDPVGRVRGRLVTSLDDLNRGGRFVSIYLELENVSDSARPIEIGAERDVRIRLVTQGGTPVPSGGMTYNAIECGPEPIRLPHASRFRYRASAGGCGCPGNEDVIVCFRYARWIIKAEDTTPYFVAGTMTIPGDDDRRARSPWRGQLVLPPTRVDMDPN